MHLRIFKKPHLKFLFETAKDHLDQYKAWNKINTLNTALEHLIKCTTIVELLESIVVYDHGDGIYAFKNGKKTCKNIEDRLLSFEDFIYERT